MRLEWSCPKSSALASKLPTSGHYLVKDGAHSGGMGVKVWDEISKLAEGEILESFVDGILASACFLADGSHALLLGITRQYSGVKELGAPPFAWCGNTTPFGDDNLQQIIRQTIDCLAASFGLIGLNGIDFIIKNETCTLLEINPRPPASFELFERLLGVNAFQLHLDACQGILPAALPEPSPGTTWGKGILYASNNIRVGDTRSWSNRQIVDVPYPGEDIPTGAPICTILSQAETGEMCWQSILEKAKFLKSEMENLKT